MIFIFFDWGFNLEKADFSRKIYKVDWEIFFVIEIKSFESQLCFQSRKMSGHIFKDLGFIDTLNDFS